MFDFLNKLFDYIMQLIPWFSLVSPDEGGVRIWFIPFCGTYSQKLKPGWYLLWPLIHETRIINVVTQPISLPEQSLDTVDGVTITISGAVQYKIKDALKALLNVQDYDKSLQIIAMKAIKSYVFNKTYKELRDDVMLEAMVLSLLKRETRNWGMDIQKVFVLQYTKARVLRLLIDKSDNNIM
jgi:regulator of protease activity HflC (stomatin/prohibitin superfamily)